MLKAVSTLNNSNDGKCIMMALLLDCMQAAQLDLPYSTGDTKLCVCCRSMELGSEMLATIWTTPKGHSHCGHCTQRARVLQLSSCLPVGRQVSASKHINQIYSWNGLSTSMITKLHTWILGTRRRTRCILVRDVSLHADRLRSTMTCCHSP
jgi:hypothetical protein